MLNLMKMMIPVFLGTSLPKKFGDWDPTKTDDTIIY